MTVSYLNKFPHCAVSNLEPCENISEHVMHFHRAIRKKLRGIMLATFDDKFWLYYPDEVFARGIISFSDLRMWHDDKPTYNVSSPHIENNKTTRGNADVYFRTSSINMDTAVRKAVKYLRKYTPTDILQATIRNVADSRLDVSVDERYAIRQLSEKICGSGVPNPALREELLHLHTLGHEFFNPEYGKNVAEYFAKHAEHVENEKAGKNYTFVTVETFNGENEFTYVDLYDLRGTAYKIQDASHDFYDYLERLGQEATVSKELPDDLLSKLAVLTVADNTTFLDGVGYKYCDEVYYVYK